MVSLNDFKIVYSYGDFAREVKKIQPLYSNAKQERFLSAVLKHGQSDAHTKILKKGRVFYRAKIGHVLKDFITDIDEKLEDRYPLELEEMKPVPEKVSEGRANPKGIAYLYCSNKIETAIHEVRPWRGSYVTVAEIKLLKDLKIVSFTTKELDESFMVTDWPFAEEAGKHTEKDLQAEMNEQILIDGCFWQDICLAFIKPVNFDDNPADYIPTQIIAEYLKNKGFDGISYNSAFGGGKNLVLFDIEAVAINDPKLKEVKNVKIEYSDYK